MIEKYIYVIILISIVILSLGVLFVKNKITFAISYSLGTGGAILYVISLYSDIIKMGLKKKVSKKGYYIRYLFSASIFLLVAILFKDKTTAVISAFLGLINVKIGAYVVGFVFGGVSREKKD